MRLLPLIFAYLILTPPSFASGDDHDANRNDDRPVLVELFTSQGCGLCPEANQYLGELDQNENVFVLAYGVSYWDMYGWRDTYARPEYVQRQRTYLPHMGVSRLYTPHFVIDGATQAPGGQQDKVLEAVENRLEEMPASPFISIEYGPFGSFIVNVDGEEPEEDLEVWLVAYSPGWASVSIDGGENEGIDMLHYNMVKGLTYLGSWEGGEAEYMGESFRHYGTVAILQGANGGQIIGYAIFEPDCDDDHSHD
jgi:hypothetical protein